jgi:glycosyltransferase involved in cell wall biosynthesis
MKMPGPGELVPAGGSMHILHVVEAFAAGTMGITCQMVNQQARDGHRVSLAYSLREETPQDWRSRLHHLVEPHHLPMTRALAPWTDLKSFLALRRLVTRLRPDVVHLHSSKAGALGRLASLTLPREMRWYFSPHGLSFLQSSEAGGVHRTYLAVERVLAKCPAQILACSPSEAGLVRQHLHATPLLVENGISIDAIRVRTVESGPGPLKVGTAGRITAARNPEFFARVARRLAGRDLRFVWLGGGDAASEDALRQAGVEVSGWLPHAELLERLAELDIYMQPSLWEGMPVAVLEAMATGLPVVASDIVGNRDVVRHGHTGALAATEDEFVDAVLKFAGDAGWREACGAAASEHVRRHHTTHTMMQSLYGAYGMESRHEARAGIA